jgi:hypothetical protein
VTENFVRMNSTLMGLSNHPLIHKRIEGQCLRTNFKSYQLTVPYQHNSEYHSSRKRHWHRLQRRPSQNCRPKFTSFHYKLQVAKIQLQRRCQRYRIPASFDTSRDARIYISHAETVGSYHSKQDFDKVVWGRCCCMLSQVLPHLSCASEERFVDGVVRLRWDELNDKS